MKQVDQVKGFGITLIKESTNQVCWSYDTDYAKGGLVSPGTYRLETSYPYHSNSSGTVDDTRVETIVSTGEPIVAKIFEKSFGSFGFLSDSYGIPDDYKFSSIGYIVNEGVYEDGEEVLEDYYEVSTGSVLTLKSGDVLHLGISKNETTSWRGSEGIVIHCTDNVPSIRAYPWGLANGTYDEDIWNSFRDRVWEAAPFVDYPQYYASGFSLPTLDTDYLMDGEYDHLQFHNVVDKLFDSAIYYRKTYDSGSTYSNTDLSNIAEIYKFCLNTPQLGWGEWSEGVSRNVWAAHGVSNSSSNRVISLIKILSVAAIFSKIIDEGYDTQANTLYGLYYEPLYSKLTIGQALHGYMPNRSCYGKDNFGTSSLADISSISNIAAHYVSSVGIEADGSGSIAAYQEMWAEREGRTATFIIMAWLCKLLGIEFSNDSKKMLHLPQSGPTFINTWGMTGSYWGHPFDPNGVFGCWSDTYNAYMARSMQWVWLLGELDDTSIFRYATKNPHFSEQSWQGLTTVNSSSSINSVYTMKTLMDQPSLSATLAGDDVTLQWDAITAPSGGGSVSYSLYKIHGLKWGYQLSSEVGSKNITVPSTAQTYDKEYGSYMASSFSLVSSGITDTSTVYELSGGEGTYHFTVKANCTVSGTGDLSANTLPARSIYADPVEVVATSQLRYSQSTSYTDPDSGIVWTFDKSYKTGTFSDGNPWVVTDGSTVTVSSITPSASVALNPVPSGTQPFDDRDSTYASATLTYPLVLSAMDSLVCTKPKGATQYTVDYFYGGKSPKVLIEDMAILTVLSAEPDSTAFRPSPYGDPSSKTMYYTSGLETSCLGSFSASGNNENTFSELYSQTFEGLLVSGSEATVAQRLERALKKPYLWMLSGNSGENIRPSQNQPSDRSDIEKIFTDAMLVLHSSDYEEGLLHAFVQQGIDMWGAVDSAASSYVPDASMSRAALLLTDYLLDGSGQVPSSLETYYVDKLYWVDTADPRIAKDSSLGMMYTSGLVGAGDDSYTWHYEPIGWTSDTTSSSTYYEHIDPEMWFDDSDVNRFDDDETRYEGSINTTAESLACLAIQDTQDTVLSSYGHGLALYYGDQWAHRPFDTSTPNYQRLSSAAESANIALPGVQGDTGTEYAKKFWQDHNETIFDSRIKVHGYYLLNHSYIPTKGYARNYLPTFEQEYGGNYSITTSGVYEGFRSDRTIRILSDNVTLRNFSIGARRIGNCIKADFVKTDGTNYENIVIEDGWCGGARGAAIVGSNLHIKDVTISNVEDDAIRIKDNCIVEDCYIDNIGMSLSTVAVGIYSVGGKGSTVRRNFVNVPHPQSDPYSARHCVWLRSRNADLSAYSIEDNWLVGSDSHTIRIGQAPSTDYAVSGTISVIRNRIGLATDGLAWNLTIPESFQDLSGNHWWDTTTNSISVSAIDDPDPSTGTPGPA